MIKCDSSSVEKQTLIIKNNRVADRTIDTVCLGGSSLVDGSQILGGRTVTSSMNSSMPFKTSSLVLAL